MKNLILLIIVCLIVSCTSITTDELLRAIYEGDKNKVLLFIEKGADVNAVLSTGEWFTLSPLIVSITLSRFEISELLIEKGADVNHRDAFNTPAIIYAASMSNKRLVEILLKHGADINDHDDKGNTVLSEAEKSKNQELISFVKEKMGIK